MDIRMRYKLYCLISTAQCMGQGLSTHNRKAKEFDDLIGLIAQTKQRVNNDPQHLFKITASCPNMN